ncbi:hypothetical protein [Streptomyces sp. NPDC101115]|uniref:hypothetical protein n=1 Tax=Streptomyces sp. NPDC101115 TaxID=3366106 RepID=UPI003820BEBE
MREGSRGAVLRVAAARVAVGGALLAVTLTGCSGGSGGSDGSRKDRSAGAGTPAASSSAPTPSRPSRAEVAQRTGALLTRTLGSGEAEDAAGPGGLMLVDAWPSGQAEYVWETADGRLCHATVGPRVVGVRACLTEPHHPPVGKPGGTSGLFTSFAEGWGRIFAADHAKVTAASCGGEPVEVIPIGTVADDARTLYAVWFPDYTKGEILLTLQRGDTTSRAPFTLGDIGDDSCAATP